MKKLTKKTYIEKLNNTEFLGAIYNKTLEEIIKRLNSSKKVYYLYVIDYIKVRSKDILIYRKDTKSSSRDFYGKNAYLQDDKFLFHINTHRGCTVIFINRIPT